MSYLKELNNYIEDANEFLKNRKNTDENRIWWLAYNHPMVQILDHIPNYRYNEKFKKYEIHIGFNKEFKLSNYITGDMVERNKLFKHRRILINNIMKYIKEHIKEAEI